MSIQLVILILYVVLLKNTLSSHEIVVWIHSPRITEWGTWGPPEICANNSWVGGMRLKIETSQGWHSDDTALNAVQLQCVNLDWIHSGNITSASGKFGTYQKTKYCPRGFATGYQIRSENNEAIDDVGAVDFKLKCTNFDGTTSYAINSDYVLPWGQWSPERICPPKTAFCGLKTQVETKQSVGDETSLNNVDLACCKIPDPVETSKLETRWETAVVCPKYRRKCEMKLTTGVVEDKKLSGFSKFYETLGFIVDLRIVQKTLEQKAKHSERINGKSMESIIGETKINKRKMYLQIDCEGIIQQLIIICGYYKVYTKEYRCVPNGDQGRFMIIYINEATVN